MTNPTISLLIVDDDPVFAAYAQQLLQSLRAEFPCECRRVDTAEQALAELEIHAYDLVLLDYHLPGADGLEVLRQIGEQPGEHQPAVIMLTASGNESIAVEAMKRGALDYLTKADLDVAPLTRALRNALNQKQLANQVAAYNAQMQSDLEMARRLQQSMLPDVYPAFPAVARVEDSALRFFHRYCPAAELAGDFFSVLRLSDTSAAIFICDVMGHGIRSALVMAMLRALVDGEAPRAHDPAVFLSAMNRRLVGLIQPSDEPMFATACHLVVDLARGRVLHSTAGHPRPIHLQRNAGDVTLLGGGSNAGPALGLFAEAGFTTTDTAIAPNDVLLLFTDGLYDVPNPQGDGEFGKGRLLEAARRHGGLPPDQLCDALIEEVRQFGGGADFADDVCVLAVHVARLHQGGSQGYLVRGTSE